MIEKMGVGEEMCSCSYLSRREVSKDDETTWMGLKSTVLSTYILDSETICVCVVEDDVRWLTRHHFGIFPSFSFLKYYLMLMTIMSDVVQLRLCMVFHQARET
jgi:hypothetical protein